MQHLQSGTLLQGGKYKIEKTLGQGGFGITYLAENAVTHVKVAIKEFFLNKFCGRDENTNHVYVALPENNADVLKFRKKFINEANTLMELNHPNIVKVYDIFGENGTSYYVMEYIDGASLNDLIEKNGCIPEYKAIEYIEKVGDALDYIHSRKIMHLDIKPHNIMLKRNGKIVVIDFGVSKQYDAETGKGLTSVTPVGISPGYSPFEQTYSGGVSSFSPESDVYALAATLYKLLTGVVPPPSPVVKDEGLSLEPLKNKGISGNVIATIVNAMKLRKERTKDVRTFLSQLLSEETIIASEETFVAIPQKTKSRKEKPQRSATPKNPKSDSHKDETPVNNETEEFSFLGMFYILAFIAIIVYVIKFLIS